LGVGPSAHSYDGKSRQYNISNNAKYLQAIAEEIIPATIEQLSAADQTNEYLLTGLRTKWGVDRAKLQTLSLGTFQAAHQKELAAMIEKGWLVDQDGTLLLTQNGKLFADRIASDLFID
jgi:oxygen-independent coproporphyrinogen-3 oxidase